MSYATIRDAIQGYIQDLAAFDVRDVVIGDMRIFGQDSDPFVIMFNGSFDRAEDTSRGGRITIWKVPLELYVRDYGDGRESEALTTHRQSIIDELDKRYKLGSTTGVVRTLLSGGDEPQKYRDEDGGGDPFLFQRMTVTVTEKTTTTGGDYA